jgi:hypothetical protein
MELGHYIYQWQPNFMGTYFYHCHRNTVQHFEFGLFGLMPIMAPDAYFASIASTNADGSVNLNDIPIGASADGKFRVAANTANFPQFPGYVPGHPVFGCGNAADTGLFHPHACTVPYDVEALWVCDDRDSVWSDMADNARATFPKFGSVPGVNDEFHRNEGRDGFFAFNDFDADYWFITGVPVPAPKGGTAEIPPGVVIPAPLNSGISGTQVSVNARVGQTILIRVLDAAYNSLNVRFPVDVVIIAFDGRPLGVPPFGRYNHAFVLPAGQPYHLTTARRFDCLIRATEPINSFGIVEFINTRAEIPGRAQEVVMTARIPIVINA